ncbi:MAG: hypothetical protein Kow0026_12580 [Oricola sp.]
MNTHHDNTGMTGAPAGETIELREAVAVFPSEDSFINAVDDLLEHGFDRSDLSVLAHDRTVRGGMSRLFEGSAALADDGTVPRGAFAAPGDIAEAKAASVALPVYAGTIGGFLVAIATGGTLAFVIPMALVGGLAGGGLGMLGATAIASRHRNSIERQLAAGGIIL